MAYGRSSWTRKARTTSRHLIGLQPDSLGAPLKADEGRPVRSGRQLRRCSGCLLNKRCAIAANPNPTETANGFSVNQLTSAKAWPGQLINVNAQAQVTTPVGRTAASVVHQRNDDGHQQVQAIASPISVALEQSGYGDDLD